MDNFLDKYHLPKLNEGHIGKLKGLISEVLKEYKQSSIFFKAKMYTTRLFQSRILFDFQRTNANTPQIVPHNRNRGYIAKLFNEAKIIFIRKPQKDIAKKEN